MSKDRFVDNTYSLAKGLHHINIAKAYFEDVRLGTTGAVKSVFNQYVQKTDWILNDMKDRLNEESRSILKKEIEDSIALESIIDKLIHLDTKQRDFIENLLESMRKGEEVKII